MSVITWLLANKLLMVAIAAALSLGISTAVLGTNNASLRKELDEKTEITTTTTTTTTKRPDTTTSEAPETTTQTTTTSEAPETSTPREDMDKYRLPTTIIPSHYDLTLKPDMETGLFDGEVIIKVDLDEEVDEIILHSNGLTINKVEVDNKEKNYTLDKKYELLIIASDGDKFKETADIKIDFSGNLTGRIVGFYRSHYKNEEGNEVSIATSKFEPTYARQAFPCFDEPNMKANFTVHLLKPDDPNYIALSNMPEVPGAERKVGNGIMVDFEESVAMSTYLACFIVSDFIAKNETIESPNPDEYPNVPLRVFATPAQLEKTTYALDTGKKVMEFYLDYFKIPYPLPKLDMVAIPDFVSGAMEHWGLVTYRETALLFDNTTSSSVNKQRVATVVAHELAHSWFGNLVTMDWWNDLWLNEGFASYIQYKGTHHAEPDWQMMNQFLIEHMHSVLILDATEASHPIVQEVKTPNQITEIFDSISYNKGASILRMLENAITPEKFQEGVTKYLKNFQFKNARTIDFLQELKSVLDPTFEVDIIDFVNTWIAQKGYPIINVEKTETGYKLTQKRFLTNSNTTGKILDSYYDYKWTIPVTYITDQNPIPTLIWFKHNETFVNIDVSSAWIKLNNEQVGFYRATYDDNNWKALIDKFDTLTVGEQAHLIEEVFRLAEARQIEYGVALSLTEKLKTIKEYIPWDVADVMFRELKKYLSTSSVLHKFKSYVVKLLTDYYNDLGWDDLETDQHLRKLSRRNIINLACAMGHQECLEKAKEKFLEWCKDKTTEIHPNLREAVYKFGMKSSGKLEWDITWERYNDETDASEKMKLLQGLTMINDIPILSNLIELAKDDTYIRSQDYFTLLQYISANPIGQHLVWDYVREHWDDLVERFTINDRYLGRMIAQITKGFTTQFKKDEMVAFFEKHPEAGAGVASRAEALETVTKNIVWLENNKAAVEAWIESKNNP